MNLYVIQVPRDEVERLDIGMITHYIRQFEKIKAPSGCADVVFSGYDDSVDEVYEIKAIREWAAVLLREAPEILYYASWDMGTTTRLLACAYDIETVTPRRMNAFEAEAHVLQHGRPQQQPVWITIPEGERLRLYGAIKGYGLKRKDYDGASRIVAKLKSVFE